MEGGLLLYLRVLALNSGESSEALVSERRLRTHLRWGEGGVMSEAVMNARIHEAARCKGREGYHAPKQRG